MGFKVIAQICLSVVHRDLSSFSVLKELTKRRGDGHLSSSGKHDSVQLLFGNIVQREEIITNITHLSLTAVQNKCYTSG